MNNFYLPIVSVLLLTACVEPAQPPVVTPPVDEFALVDGGETVASIETVNVECVARVIGSTPQGETCPNPNNTMKRFNLGSTDFGNMWDAGNGEVWSVFGDNFNDRGANWKSNAIAFSTDRDLTDGLGYDDVMRDDSGAMKEFILSRAKTGQNADGSEYEVTCIPTGGVSVSTVAGNRQYVNYMSIHQWQTDGNDSWSVNYSEIVYSDDYGKTWTRSGVKWAADSHFTQIAYVRRDNVLYMYGTASGRHDNVYLAKVATDKVLDKNAYTYWNGESWSADEGDAAPVANGHVSEMTVRYNTYYKRYIMMYLSVNQRKVVYRDAADPEGEWSAEKIILDSGYGPSIHPWFCDGRDLWFVLSSVTSSSSVSYDTWHIHLYHAKLRADADEFNMVWESGFENEPNESIAYKTLWNVANSTSTRDCHSGKIACKLTNRNVGEWKDACTQTIRVHKNTDYIVSGWAKASIDGHTGAYLGVRLTDGTICDNNSALASDQWRQITKEFNSGDNTSLDLFFGSWGVDGLNVIIDDIKLIPKTQTN